MTARGEARRSYELLLAIETDDCVLWPHSVNSRGYGQLAARNSVLRYVHVMACEHHHGQRPEGMQAAHSCASNRRCMNGRHLRWATPTENQADRLIHGTDQRGEKSHRALLTEADVHAIRHGRTAGIPAALLAEQYGVATVTINAVWKRRRWGWLPDVDTASAAA